MIRLPIVLTLALAAGLGGCGRSHGPIQGIPIGGPVGAPVAGSEDEDAIPLSELEGHLDTRMVDRVFPRDRRSVEIVLCDRRRFVVDAAPTAVQAAMLERAYRPGCR